MASNVGVFGNDGGLFDNVPKMGSVFRNAGYAARSRRGTGTSSVSPSPPTCSLTMRACIRSRSVSNTIFASMRAENVHQERDRAGPPCLVAGPQPCSVVAVEVLVEQDEVAPMRIFLKLLRPSVDRSPATRIA